MTAASDALFVRGDVDGSGRCDATDAVRLLEYLDGGAPPRCLDAADANDDGRVDNLDVVAILESDTARRSLPPPGASCGVDPSRDALDCVAGACSDADVQPDGDARTVARDPGAGDFVTIEGEVGGSRYLRLRPQVEIARGDFFSVYRELLGLDLLDELELKSESSPADSTYRSSKYRQLHDGLPVVGAEFVLVERHGHVRFAMGRLIAPLPSGAETTLVSDTAAREIALADLALRENVWRDMIMFAVEPAPAELVISSRDATWEPDSYRLAWRFQLLASQPRGDFTIDIDALTGETVFYLDQTRHIGCEVGWETALCEGTTLLEGVQNFTAEEELTTGTHRLRTCKPEYGIRTFDNGGSTDVSLQNDVTSGTDEFHGAAQVFGVSAHWIAEVVLEYFHTVHGRNGIDGAGATITNRANFGSGLRAKYVPTSREILISDSGPPANSSYAALDVLGHEITHGVVAESAGLVYAGESGALDESFADIFGTVIELETSPIGNWSMGEQIYPAAHPNVLRWIDMPKGTGKTPPIDPSLPFQPTTYFGKNWFPIGTVCDRSTDYCGVHTNSGVQNRWFYLLSTGGSGKIDEDPTGWSFHVDGIGLQAAARIAFHNLTTKLVPSSDYSDSRTGSVLSAIELFGEFSQQQASVENAWHAVGVGQPADDFYHEPTDGATGVDPWPVTIHWEAGIDQTEFDLEISEDATFTATPAESLTISGTTVSGAFVVGEAKVFVKPSTTYYWRVREHSDGEPKGWRAAKSFSTDHRTPTIVSPVSADPVYPWKVTFRWNKVPGGRRYEVEVAEDAAFSNPIYYAELFYDVDSVELVARKGKKLYWRVRAYPQHVADNSSLWASTDFLTTNPVVTQASPTMAQLVHPWDARFKWNATAGAAKYILEVSADRKLFDANIFDSFEIDASTTEASVVLRPERTDPTTPRFWRVSAVGPSPNYLEGSPWESTWPERVHSPIWSFVNDGDKTIVGDLEPDQSGSWTVGYGEELLLRWKDVTNATSYQIEIFRITDRHNFGVNYDSPVLSQVYPAVLTWVPSKNRHELSIDTLSFNLLPSTSCYGFVWHVRAWGPVKPVGGSDHGVEWSDGYAWWIPDAPIFLAPAYGATDVDYQLLEIQWTSEFSPTGKYQFNIYETNFSNLFFSEVVLGNPGGVSTGILNLLPSTTYYVEIYAWAPDPPAPDQWHAEEEWIEFTTAAQSSSSSEPEFSHTPPTVASEMWGNTNQLYAFFTPVPGASTYEFEVYSDALPSNGGTLALAQGFGTQQIINNMQSVLDQIASQTGEPQSSAITISQHALFAVFGGTVDGTVYYWRVRACEVSDCGDWSQWATFEETTSFAKAFYAWAAWLSSVNAPSLNGSP